MSCVNKNKVARKFILFTIVNMIKFFAPIILLTISNVFMTFAWYGHLKHKSTALWIVILVCWYLLGTPTGIGVFPTL